MLADAGINEKVAPGTWKGIVDIIIDGIKKGKQGDAIAEAVSAVGNILREHFPVKPDDIDELDNLIVDE